MDTRNLLSSEDILRQLDNSDLEDEFDDEVFDDLDLDPDYSPNDDPTDAGDGEEAEADEDAEVSAEEADNNSDHQVPAPPSKPKSHSWKKTPFPSKDDPPQNYVNTEHQVLSPAQYFEKYFTSQLFETFAFYTNQYYQQQNGRPLNPPCTAAEVKKFFGIHGLIGIFKYPRVRMYWGTRFQFKEIAECMSRDRFFALRVNLHCVDNLGVSQADQKANRLWKVQPVISAVRERCLELERGFGSYSIDEQMIPFLGSCPVRQVVKNKPRPVGLKKLCYNLK